MKRLPETSKNVLCTNIYLQKFHYYWKPCIILCCQQLYLLYIETALFTIVCIMTLTFKVLSRLCLRTISCRKFLLVGLCRYGTPWSDLGVIIDLGSTRLFSTTTVEDKFFL